MGMPTIIDKPANNEATHCGVDELRQSLDKLGSWPEAGDEYISLMTTSLWDRIAVRSQDFDWIPRVVADAKKGVDIGLRYPSFFQKLIANGKLRTRFVKQLHGEK